MSYETALEIIYRHIKDISLCEDLKQFIDSQEIKIEELRKAVHKAEIEKKGNCQKEKP